MKEIVLIKVGEIILKGLNRKSFESKLIKNIKSALDIQLKYLDLIEALFCEVNPIPVKAAMKLLGYDVGGLRLPLTELEDANRARLKESKENLKEN